MSFELFDITAKRAEMYADKLAMRELVSGYSVTYGELDRNAGQSAALLAQYGVDEGDRVAILCRNRIAFFEILFACAKIGAVLVPLNWRMPANELAVVVNDAAPKVLFYGAEDAESGQSLASKNTPVINLDDGFQDQRAALTPLVKKEKWAHDDLWYLLYTSGTTGKPKAVMQTFGMALANYVNVSQAVQLVDTDVTLNFLPLFHTAGINLHTLPALMEGATTLVLPGFEIETVMDLLCNGDLDNFFGVPAIYQAISLHPRFDEIKTERIKNWGCGAAPLPEALINAYAERGVRICNGYGMTETGPTVFLMDEAAALERIASVGKPKFLTRVRIVGADGKDVARGESGEIWMAGPNITPGYWHNEEATKATFTEDHWLKSGDLGRQDEDGYYYIVGRIKEMFISGGENVYPAEVENALCQHPAILEAAVLGVEDARWGEVGHAYLMPRPGRTIPDAEELIAFCRANLAAYKVPKAFTVVEDFPRTAAGKVQKHLIRERENA